MSTRIYKGFRLATDSLSEALRIVERFRPWVTGQADQVLDTFMYNMKKEGADAVKAFDTWQDLRRLMRTQQRRVPQVDTDFTVLLIPSAVGMLGIVYTERSAWFEAWCLQEGVQEYSYWDNADAPEDCTEEWLERGKAWSVLNSGPASMQGFSIELVSPEGPVPKAWRS